MVILAHDILAKVSSKEEEVEVAIDVALTRHPFFVDKAAAIASYAPYLDPVTRTPPAQIHLLGFDSLVRLLDTKYYPPSHTLEPLKALFSRHKVRVTLREDDKYGGKEEQEKYAQALAEGAREGEGGKREWAERIELVAGEAARGVSSTRAREVTEKGEWHRLEGLVSRKMREWIEEQNPYKIP
ncbi:MAG: hypothetical protein Q9167_005360 [Letrouitia subvulpina]